MDGINPAGGVPGVRQYVAKYNIHKKIDAINEKKLIQVHEYQFVVPNTLITKIIENDMSVEITLKSYP